MEPVEIRSRSDSLGELKVKLEEYIANGTALAWLIDPYLRQIHIYQPGAAASLLEEPNEVSGEPVLVGFTLNTRLLW